MTRRERLEAKVEKREQWAEGRSAKAAELHAQNEPFRGDNAFNTQPGHIPERARVIRRTERAWEHSKMAEHHVQKAEGLERQLAGSIYSDDEDAVEALEARITELEAKRDRIKADNAAFRKAHKEELKALTPYGRNQIMPHASYELTNLSGNIKRNRDRLTQIKAQQERTQRAEANDGVVVEILPYDYARVTFAEKPAREVLDALKAAGFSWGSGSWTGKADQLPEGLR